MNLKSFKSLAYSRTIIALLALSSVNMATATTLAEYLLEKNEKLAVMEGHAQVQSSQVISSLNSTRDAKKASPLARAMAQSSIEVEQETQFIEKTLTLEISELQDNSGLVYLGGKVSEVELSRYLKQLKNKLGKEKYAIYRQHQAARDHQSFHITLVNPYEYQTINKEKFNLSQKFRVTLHGIGKVAKGDKESYFVVASSPDGQFIRQKLLLNNKDFHVTLGFYPDDVYGVSKGRDTLISK